MFREGFRGDFSGVSGELSERFPSWFQRKMGWEEEGEKEGGNHREDVVEWGRKRKK